MKSAAAWLLIRRSNSHSMKSILQHFTAIDHTAKPALFEAGIQGETGGGASAPALGKGSWGRSLRQGVRTQPNHRFGRTTEGREVYALRVSRELGVRASIPGRP